jgi:DNA-binding CsgD family transcriptional regulator/PAS domain-containing protein
LTDSLLLSLYAAPGTTDGWTRFLELLRQAVGGASASLMSHRSAPRGSSFTANAGADPEGLALYARHWCRHDPWAKAALHHSPAAGTVLPGDALVPHAEIRRSAFYADFGRSFDCVRVIAATLENHPAGTTVVSVLGHERRPPFGVSETALLETLVPHLQNAVQLHRRLTVATATIDALGSAYERCGCGVIVTGADGRCVYANDAATTVLAQRDGLLLDRGELRTTEPATTRQLRQLIAGTANHHQSLGSGRLLAVNRPSGRRPYSLLVSPGSMPQDLDLARDCPAAVVSIVDLDASPPTDHATLQSLYGLTPAEARLAVLLAQGYSLHAAADCLGVTRHTVRSVLKVVMSKTRTHRQAELVRLLLRTMPL